MSDFN